MIQVKRIVGFITCYTQFKCNILILYVLDVIERSVIAEVQVDEIYQPEFNNTSSDKYKDFVSMFRHQVSNEACIYNQAIAFESSSTFTCLVLMANAETLNVCRDVGRFLPRVDDGVKLFTCFFFSVQNLCQCFWTKHKSKHFSLQMVPFYNITIKNFVDISNITLR